ncbi:SAM-dependent DNA methylase domain-containing protein [Desulfonema magnum]|uniref:site-specific DNA-methyltransferase (adenine-specific) n=2 Tax=Desulfonema magnum TaxID=45655 RepID=A0A975BNC0_9BACT|nr:SAM-dependent DNA methylase domain-containing protein [Desulfonema magnum]
MTGIPIERITRIKSFPSLVKFLRDDLYWPLDAEDIEDLTFEYEPEELGIDPKIAVKIKEIKQLRPLAVSQPWGIFYISFEPKQLPVVVLRRILRALVIKKRQSSNPANLPAWKLHDLLFISSYGEEDQRAITFAHFREDSCGDLPTLQVIGWDSQDTPLHIDQCIQELDKLRFDGEFSPDQWREQWSSAFTLRHREVISTSKELAAELARLAGQIRRRVNAVLRVESRQGAMHRLFQAIQETLLHDLSEDQFADMFAQTIAYGLFSARCSRESGALVADNLTDMIPETNLFLRELLSTFFSIGGRKGKIDFDELGINDVVEMLRDANMEAVLGDFEDRNPSEDPVIHFYEGFLKQYDAQQKIKRGAFYTPRPVVSFIVRSVHEILRKDFGLEDGLADTTTWGEMTRQNREIKIPKGVSEDAPFVQILDPATGTGTFLVEVIDLIHKTMVEKWEAEGEDVRKRWNEYVPKHLLPRIYGFELMMAPYTIAHMKIALKLVETKYVFKFNEIIQIHLTNSLEEAKDTIPGYLEDFSPALAHEAKVANSVKKDARITVVVGNPPYSVSSCNNTSFLANLMKTYKNAVRNEKNIQPLSDDYIKFIRFTHWKIEKAGKGVIGLITNNSFIDGLIHRGMREELINTFNNIYILNLHGNTNRGDVCSDGSKDENVFDIKQGVSISFFVKKRKINIEKSSSYYSLKGLREKKSNFFHKNLVSSVQWERTDIAGPNFWFVRKKFDAEDKYYKDGISVIEIFNEYNNGIEFGRDNLFIDFEKNNLIDRINILFSGNYDNAFVEKYNVKDTSCFALLNRVSKYSYNEKNIYSTHYRPFDFRNAYYQLGIVRRPSYEIIKHFLNKKNIGLICVRQYVEDKNFNHCFITNTITDRRITVSNRGAGFIFPLYCYPDGEAFNIGKTENFNNRFSKLINSLYTFRPLTDQILAYIYAILHSPTYRNRYAEFLKIDFPRIPFTTKENLFLKLSDLGSELIGLHLLESEKLNKPITTFPVSGDNSITKVGEAKKQLKYMENGKGRLYINKTQYFDGLSEDVWNFHIGGYQVCHKWLYDRKKAKRRLSEEDITHYHKIVVALNETMRLMRQIDQVIDAHGGWPIQ